MRDLRRHWESLGHPNAAAVAGELREKLQEKGVALTQRNLENQINRLARGDTTWFRRHSEVRKTLADVLELAEDDIVPDRPSRGRDDLFSFEEFPTLRPYDPRTEAPLDLGTLHGERHLEEDQTLFDWFQKSPNRGHRASSWVVMPHGSGRAFAAHWYRVRHAGAVRLEHDIRSLATGDDDEDSRVVISQDRLTTEVDRMLLIRLGKRPNVLVLSPYEPHSTPQLAAEILPTWEYRTGHPAAVDVLSKSFGFHEYRWKAQMGWRRRFLDWLEARAPDHSRFKAATLDDWLDTIDPHQLVFTTPGDLLPLAARVSDHGLARFQKDVNAGALSNLLQLQLDASFTSPSARDVWLRGHGVRVFERLASHHARDVVLPLARGLSKTTWAAMLRPEEQPSLGANDDVAAMLGKLGSANEAGRKKALSALRERVENGLRPSETIEFLASANLLKQAGPDAWALSPGWLSRHSGRRTIAAALADEPDAWGPLVMDPERRILVHGLLLSMDGQAFTQLAQRVVKAYSAKRLGPVAAVETLFRVIPNRPLSQSSAPAIERHVLALAIQQLEARDPSAPPVPVTRTGFAHDDDGYAFLADCWAWSMRAPAPVSYREESMAWLFPGWSRPEIADCPSWLHAVAVVPRKKEKWEYRERPPTASAIRLVEAGEALSDAFAMRVPFDAVPEALLVAVFRAAIDARLPLPSACLQALSARWVAGRVARSVEAANSAAWAASLWRAVLADPACVESVFGLNHLRSDHDIAKAILDHLRVADFLQALDAFGPTAIAGRTAMLPPRLRNALATWLVDKPRELIEEFYARRSFGFVEEDLDGLRTVFNATWSPVIAAQIRRLAPEEAAASTHRLLTSPSPESAWPWLVHASLNESTVEALEALAPIALTPWLVSWLRSRLPFAGALATRVYSLITAATATQLAVAERGWR